MWTGMEQEYRDRTFEDEDGGVSAIREDRLFIRKLPGGYGQKGLENLFSKFGTVTSSYMHPNNNYAMVTFETVEQARTALEALNKTPPLNLQIRFAFDKAGHQKSGQNKNNHTSNAKSVVNNTTREPLGAPIARSVRTTSMSAYDPVFTDEMEDSFLDEDDIIQDVDQLEVAQLKLQKAEAEYQLAMVRKRQAAGNSRITNGLQMVIHAQDSAAPSRPGSSVGRRVLVQADVTDGVHRDEPPPLLKFVPVCVECKRTSIGLCVVCRIVPYCSVTCQRADWPRHSKSCVHLATNPCALPVITANAWDTTADYPVSTKVITNERNGHAPAGYKPPVFNQTEGSKSDHKRPHASAERAQRTNNHSLEDGRSAGDRPGRGPRNLKTDSEGPQKSDRQGNRFVRPEKSDRNDGLDRPKRDLNGNRDFTGSWDRQANGSQNNKHNGKNDNRSRDSSGFNSRQPSRGGKEYEYIAKDDDFFAPSASSATVTAKSVPAATSAVPVTSSSSPAPTEPVSSASKWTTPAPTVTASTALTTTTSAPTLPVHAATIPSAATKGETPKNYVAELADVGSPISLSVEAQGEDKCVLGAAVDTPHSDQYMLLVETLGEACEKETKDFMPTPGDIFGLQCPDGWYRARCLDTARAALIDSGRIVEFAGLACRTLPAQFRDIPEMCALVRAEAELKVGESYVCTVTSKSSDCVVSGVSTAEGIALGEARLVRWRPPVVTQHHPIAASTPDKATEQPDVKSAQPIEAVKQQPNNMSNSMSLRNKPLSSGDEDATEQPVKDQPSEYSASFSAGKELALMVVDVADDRFICLALPDNLTAKYTELIDPLAEQCNADTVAVKPQPGELFCLQDADEGWYRARLLSSGEVALIDAGRTVPLDAQPCRRLPAQFAHVPQFVCTLETLAKVAVNDTLKCQHLSSTGEVHTVSLTLANDSATFEGKVRRWTPYAVAPATKQRDSSSSKQLCSASTQQQYSPPVKKQDASLTEDLFAKYGTVVEQMARPPLVAGTTVVIVEVVSTERVLLRPADSTLEFDAIVHDVAAYGLSAAPLKTPPPVGAVVLSKYEEVFYRAAILRTKHSENKFLLQYLEFGNEEVVLGMDRLRVCPPQLAPSVRRVLVSCNKLAGAPKVLSDDANKYLAALKDNAKPLTVSLPDGKGTALTDTEVILTEVESKVVVGTRLDHLSKPGWKKIEEQGGSVLDLPLLTIADLNYVSLPRGEVEVHVHSYKQIASGALFACVKNEPLLAYVADKLPKELEEYCSSRLCAAPYLPRDQELCVARLRCRGTPTWCRAVSYTQPDGPGGEMVNLICLDHGSDCMVPHTEIRKMIQEFVRTPVTGLLLTIKGFPEELTSEQLSRVMAFLSRSPLVVLAGQPDEEGEYTVEAPALLALINQ